MDPGSAAHRHSVSKTRVNALMALRYAAPAILVAIAAIAVLAVVKPF